MRVLAALRRSLKADVQARLHHALTMEKLYVEGQALGLTDEELVRLETVAAQRARDRRIPLARPFRCEVYAYGGHGCPPPPAVTTAEQVAVVNTLVRRLGRLILIDLFSRLAPEPTTEAKETSHARR